MVAGRQKKTEPVGQEMAQPKTGLRKSVGVRMGRSRKKRKKKKRGRRRRRKI